MNKVKIGDKVYFPPKSTKVLTICRNSCSSEYPIVVLVDSERHPWSLTTDGKVYVDDALPSLFHATPEMKAKLEDLYGVEFEVPPVKPTSREIIQAMLARGDKYVLCRATNCESDDCYFVLIERVFEDGGYIDSEGTIWDSAKPINPRTGIKITELPVGEYNE